MLVEGYSMKQQSAIVVSEYLSSFERTWKTSTRDDQPCLYSPLYRRPLWNTLNLLVMYEGKYRGQWLWEKQQSTVGGTDLPARNGAKSPNWSTAIPMLASHEVGTSPKPSKSIHMVSGPMLVEGYSMKQQSAVVVSEYLPSFERTWKTSTRDDQPCLYSPLHRRPLWNTLNLLVMYEGKYRGQWLWEKQQSTVGGTDLPARNGAKSPNWSTNIPMLASHEVGTSPKPSKSIHMVSGPMLVEGYSMKQQSAVVVSEYLPSFERTRKTSTRDDQPCLYSPLHRRPLWNTLNLLVMYEGKYRGQWLWQKQQSTVAGTDLPRRPNLAQRFGPAMWTATWLHACQGGSSFILLWGIEGVRKWVGHPPTRNGKCWVSSIRIAAWLGWLQAKTAFWTTRLNRFLGVTSDPLFQHIEVIKQWNSATVACKW